MGNQHPTGQNTVTRTEQYRDRSNYQNEVIDLDEIIEQWVWNMWNRTKTKSFSHRKREELLVKINWKQVAFSQTKTNFTGSPPVSLPKSQILFRTHFNNHTTTEQSYSFKTERFTRSTFKFIFTHCLRKSQHSMVVFYLPEEIVRFTGGIKLEQYADFGQDTVKEYSMCWGVNTQIHVAPRTCTYAELNIDEEEFNGDFAFFIQFFGRITATVSTRESPDNYLQFMDGDIVEIIREAIDCSHRWNDLEVTSDYPSVVRYKIRGKCSFRYGTQQHVVLNQQPLDSSSSSLSERLSSQSKATSVQNEMYLNFRDI
ncbi:unnamed protein product [Adineta ricciae]|uniref:Uncharacterized protein n=1 Tax=Adineta ricciae TaxID=249248 RepID=A0A814T2T9_ADIRI|nr:unnamed protein product [Adineta ricciae]